MNVPDLIGREQRPSGLMRGPGDTRFGGIERTGHGLELDGLVAEEIRDQAGCLLIVDAEDLEDAGIREEGSGARAIGGLELVDVLENRPELETVTGHETHGAFDRGETAEACELVEEEQHRLARLLRFTCHGCQARGQHQAQPIGIGLETIRRQDEEDRCRPMLQVCERKIRARQNRPHARAVQKMRMPLCSREHAGGFPIGFAEMAVCSSCDEPMRLGGLLHALQKPGEGFRGEGEVFPEG